LYGCSASTRPRLGDDLRANVPAALDRRRRKLRQRPVTLLDRNVADREHTVEAVDTQPVVHDKCQYDHELRPAPGAPA